MAALHLRRGKQTGVVRVYVGVCHYRKSTIQPSYLERTQAFMVTDPVV